MNPIEWAKANPIPAGAIVIGGVVVIFVIFSNAGGGGVTTVVSGPSDAQIAAEAQLQQLRIQASDANSLRQAQVQMAQFERDVDLANVSASLEAIESNNATSLQIETIRSTRDQALASLSAETAMRGFSAQETAARYAAETSANQTAAQLEATRLNTQAAVQVETLRNQTELRLGEIAGRNQEIALAVDERNTQALIGGAVTLAGIQGNNAINIARIEADAAKYSAKQQADAEKRKSSNSLIGSVIGGIASIFSDERMKTNVSKVGVDPNNGLPLYTYQMNGEWRLGHMAQDVALAYPAAIVRGPGDAMMYNPRMLH
jgi:murein L,D-transpeptidase YcbB/YkuD